MSNKISHRQAVLLMICATGMLSVAGVFTRHLEVARGVEVTFWRSLFTALFVAAVMLKQYGRAAIPRLRALGTLGLASGFMWAIMFSCFMIALTMTTVANTSIMESLAPLFTAFLAWLVLREKISARTWLSITVAAAGIVWMFAGRTSQVDQRGLFGMLIGLGVPLASALNVIILKKKNHVVDLIPAVLMGGLISALLMLPFALPLLASAHDIVILALLGCFQLGLPCVLLVMASSALSAPEFSLLILLKVLLSPIWAWLGAAEVPSAETIIGGCLILAALLWNELGGLSTKK